MEELPLDFIVLDDDVMSMEMPFFFRDLYLVSPIQLCEENSLFTCLCMNHEAVLS